MFGKILIADRGESALRVLRACREFGARTVLVHSDGKRDTRLLRSADELLCIGAAEPRPGFLNPHAIVSAAQLSGAQAIHPGCSELAEDADFAAFVEAAGLAFIGSRPETTRLMHDAAFMREVAKAVGLPCVPRAEGFPPNDRKEVARIAHAIGYPIAVRAKQDARLMQVASAEADLANALTLVRNQAEKWHGHFEAVLEKYLPTPRRIGIQMLSDAFRNPIHLGEVDTTLQAFQRDVVSESPGLVMPQRQLSRLVERCTEACRRLNLRGLCTFYFLLDAGEAYFDHASPCLNASHAAAEMTSGIDFVLEQIRLASGEKQRFRQREIESRGHAITCHVYANPRGAARAPAARVTTLQLPGGPGIRIDSPIGQGETLLPSYDSVIARITAHGESREQAIRRMRTALAELRIDGLRTTIPLLQELMYDTAFIKSETNLRSLEQRLAAQTETTRFSEQKK